MAIRKMVLSDTKGPDLKLKDTIGEYKVEVLDVFGHDDTWVQVKLRVKPVLQPKDLDTFIKYYGKKVRRQPESRLSGETTVLLLDYEDKHFNFEVGDKPGQGEE